MTAVARLLKAEGELNLAESFAMRTEGVLEPRLGVGLPSLIELMEELPMLAETLDERAEEKFRLGRLEGMEREGALDGGNSTSRAHVHEVVYQVPSMPPSPYFVSHAKVDDTNNAWAERKGDRRQGGRQGP